MCHETLEIFFLWESKLFFSEVFEHWQVTVTTEGVSSACRKRRAEVRSEAKRVLALKSPLFRSTLEECTKCDEISFVL
jgi:hypothetical protein